MSRISGAASIESYADQMVCIVIREPRKPSAWMWSHAVLMSPRSGTLSMCSGRDHVLADQAAQPAGLRRELAAHRLGVGEGRAVAAAEQVRARPRVHVHAPRDEHRRDRGAEQGLAGLAVLPGEGDAALVGEGPDRREG